MSKEDLQLLYGLREEFDEVNYRQRENQDLSNVYVFGGGISDKFPASEKGSFDIEGLNYSVKYTLDNLRQKQILRISHTFEEIENALNGNDEI